MIGKENLFGYKSWQNWLFASKECFTDHCAGWERDGGCRGFLKTIYRGNERRVKRGKLVRDGNMKRNEGNEEMEKRKVDWKESGDELVGKMMGDGGKVGRGGYNEEENWENRNQIRGQKKVEEVKERKGEK